MKAKLVLTFQAYQITAGGCAYTGTLSFWLSGRLEVFNINNTVSGAGPSVTQYVYVAPPSNENVVASAFEAFLNGSTEWRRDYNISRDGNAVTIEAKEYGDEWNFQWSGGPGHNGCITVTQTNNTDPLDCDGLSIRVVYPVDVTESESGTVTIVADAPDGAVLEYSIDGTNWQSGNFFGNLEAGDYTASVRYRDAADCVKTRIFSILPYQPDVFTSTETYTANCWLGTTGNYTATATATSTISQGDADEKALAAARETAEANLVCTVQPGLFTPLENSVLVSGETIGYSRNFRGFYSRFSWTFERSFALGGKMVSFKDGVPWLHESTRVNRNNFFGQQYYPEVKFTFHAEDANSEKVPQSIGVNTNQGDISVNINSQEGQSSSLNPTNFHFRRDEYHAGFLRDETTPDSELAEGETKRLHGRVLRSQIFDVAIKVLSDAFTYLRSAIITYQPLSPMGARQKLEALTIPESFALEFMTRTFGGEVLIETIGQGAKWVDWWVIGENAPEREAIGQVVGSSDVNPNGGTLTRVYYQNEGAVTKFTLNPGLRGFYIELTRLTGTKEIVVRDNDFTFIPLLGTWFNQTDSKLDMAHNPVHFSTVPSSLQRVLNYTDGVSASGRVLDMSGIFGSVFPEPAVASLAALNVNVIMDYGPTNLQISEQEGFIRLDWQDNSENEVAFEIWRGTSPMTDPVAEGTLVATLNPDTQTGMVFLDTNSQDSGTFYYRVRARSKRNVSPFSNEVFFSLQAVPPTGLTATAVGTTAIRLDWTDTNNGTASYRVYFRVQGETKWVFVADVGPGGTTFLHNGLTPSTAYEHYVVAVQNEVESDPSNTATATTGAPLIGTMVISVDSLIIT